MGGIAGIRVPYIDFEKAGIHYPVVNMKFDLRSQLIMNDSLTVKTIINYSKKVRLIFEYDIFNQKFELISKAATTLAFVKKETHKTCYSS